MKKVIVIGSGPAGLTARYELLKTKKYEVIILEESDSIGGISKTVNYRENRMDIEGHSFFSKDKRVISFWNEIMPLQGYKSYDDKILKRVSRIFYLNKFFIIQ